MTSNIVTISLIFADACDNILFSHNLSFVKVDFAVVLTSVSASETISGL